MLRELSVRVFDKSDISSELVGIYLKELEGIKSVEFFSDYIAGYESCSQIKPDLVIVDISENMEFCLDIVSKLSRQGISVAVMSVSTSSSVIIKALRNGAVEFLTKPVLKSDLKALVNKLANPVEENEIEECKVMTLYSGKGGSGKTTVAVNLALELAKQTGKRTALVDLNFCLGEVSSYLNLKNSFSLSNTLDNVEKIDCESLVEMFEKYGDTELYVLAEPATGETFSAITFSKIVKFFKVLKEAFSYVIVDIPTIADDKILKVLQISDYVLYVTGVNLNAIKNSKYCIDLLKDKGLDDSKIRILLNRFIENDELTDSEIESELGLGVYKKIPNNYFTVMAAINKGVPVSEENINSNVAESFRELAIMLSDSIMKNSLKGIRGNYEYKREN